MSTATKIDRRLTVLAAKWPDQPRGHAEMHRLACITATKVTGWSGSRMGWSGSDEKPFLSMIAVAVVLTACRCSRAADAGNGKAGEWSAIYPHVTDPRNRFGRPQVPVRSGFAAQVRISVPTSERGIQGISGPPRSSG